MAAKKPRLERVYRLISNNLLELRVKHNLTQEQLAKRVKIERGVIANYETHRTRLQLHEILKLAKYFKTTMRRLMA